MPLSKVETRQPMVKKGRRPRSSLVDEPIEPLRFSNPLHPRFEYEILWLAVLRRRVPSRHSQVHTRLDFHQLLLVESGLIEHNVDFERHRCGAGSVLHVRPGQVQRFLRNADAQGWAILFCSEFLPADPLLEVRLGPADAALISLPKERIPSISSTARALAAAYDVADGQAVSVQELRHLLSALVLQVIRAHDEVWHRARRVEPRILSTYRRFLQDLEGHFAQSRNATDYAARTGCSIRTLSRACETLAGSSPKNLIEKRVTLEAKRLLAHSSLSVSAIGNALVFSEPTNFVKFFRRCEGRTPAAFRREGGFDA